MAGHAYGQWQLLDVGDHLKKVGDPWQPEMATLDQLLVAENFAQAAGDRQPAAAQQANLPGVKRHQIDIVRRHDNGHALPVEFQQQPHQPALAHRVEAGGWLIQNQNPRLHGQHPGDGQALLLAVAQVMDRPVEQIGNRHLRRHPREPALHFLIRQTQIPRPVADVVAHGRREYLVVGILEDKADSPVDLVEVLAPDFQAGHRDSA